MPDNDQKIQWAPASSPVSIEYSLDLMSKIRDHVIVGFHRLAKRGIECGGILFGTREGRRIVLREIREIRCEYKNGPSFVLSEADREALARQLSPDYDAALAGLVPVGFYVSHTKDDVAATERDLAIFDQFFRSPWQVMLILRPARQGAVRGGFFVREPLGHLQGERSYEEFQLDPPADPAETAALMAAARAQSEPAEPQPRVRSGKMPAAEAIHPAFTGPNDPALPEFLPRERALAPFQPAGAGRGAQLALASDVPRFAYPGRQQQQPRQRHWSWLIAWFAGVFVIGYAAYWMWSIRTPDPILLRVAEVNGDLRIEWDRASGTVQGSSEGLLEIRDRQQARTIHLSPEQLALGHYLFPATTSDTAVRLKVTGFLRPEVEESVNFVAEAQPGSGPRGPAEVREQRDRLLFENRKLKNDMKRLEDRLRQLEQKAGGNPANTRTRKK